MRPWLGYVRVSFVGGREGDAFRSPRDQEAAIREWAARRNEPVEMLPPELDQSGAATDRPVLTEAIARIERGEARGLVVAYLSRAARNVRLLLDLDERIRRAGGKLVSVAEETFDPTTPVGGFGRTVLAAVAQLELDMHRERFERLREDTVARGVWARRVVPRGYRRNPHTRRLEPDPEWAPIVVRAFERAAAGAPTLELARMLRLTPSGARQLLRNRVYLGELRIGRYVNPDAHPPLVGEGLWLAAQRRPARTTERAGVRLLSGLVRCRSCGHVMVSSGSVLRCQIHHSQGDCPAPAAITRTHLERHVERTVVAHLEGLMLVGEPRTDIRERIERELERARRELHGFLAATEFAGADPATVGGALKQRLERVQRLEHQLAALASPVGVRLPVPDAWRQMPVERRNHLLRHLLETVAVRPAGRGRRVPIAERTRIVLRGAGVVPGRHRWVMPIAPLRWLPLDSPHVLTPVDVEERREHAGEHVR